MKPAKRPSAALQTALFPHENDQRAARAPEGPNHSALGPRGGLSIERPSARPAQPRTQYFTASTCRKCGHVILAGQILGLRLDLEPAMLNDITEYQALRDGVPTYDLWPDRTARRRHLEEIKYPDRVPRHARHTCGTTYGTDPRPEPPARPAINPDDPQF